MGGSWGREERQPGSSDLAEVVKAVGLDLDDHVTGPSDVLGRDDPSAGNTCGHVGGLVHLAPDEHACLDGHGASDCSRTAAVNASPTALGVESTSHVNARSTSRTTGGLAPGHSAPVDEGLSDWLLVVLLGVAGKRRN